MLVIGVATPTVLVAVTGFADEWMSRCLVDGYGVGVTRAKI